MKKRVFSLLLVLTLLLPAMPAAHAAGSSGGLDGIAYYGDRSKCAMTAEQATAFLDRIELEKCWDNSKWLSTINGRGYNINDCLTVYYAALFDLGNGIPALFFVRTCSPQYPIWELGEHSIWLYENGTTVPFTPDWDGSASWELHDSYIRLSYSWFVSEYKIYPFSNGTISTKASTSARQIREENWSVMGHEIDGKAVSEAAYLQWEEKWTGGVLAYGSLGTFDMSYSTEGLTPIDEAETALRSYIAARNSVRVTLWLNGGVGDTGLWTDDAGHIRVPTNPTRDGYTFGGWYMDEALTKPWNFNAAVSGPMTLYAKWVPVSSTAATVVRSGQSISLNGVPLTGVEGYTLIAPNGGEVTYVKLRDIAAILDGSSAQFNVDWKDGVIYVERGKPYTTRNGKELRPIEGTDGSYRWNTAPILFDGETQTMEGIVLDGKGGSHTFFKLRDLADALNFTVNWAPETGITIETR